jgi:AcrR family transcriptional regulator
VAQNAQVSRGGVLYHFPSKEALIEGMLQRLLKQFETILDEEMAKDSGRGQFTRAFARAALRVDQRTISASAPILAAIAYEPSLLEAFRKPQEAWQKQMEIDTDRTVAAIVRLTSFALWLNQIVSADSMSIEERERIVAYLENMAR